MLTTALTDTSAATEVAAPDVLLWDVEAAASATGLRVRYVRKLIAERRVPVVKLGRLVRIRPADLVAYIEASTLPVQER